MTQKKLKMMISSRSDTFSIPDGNNGKITLREVRLQLKQDLESAAFLSGGLLEVWINEAETAGDFDTTAWEECILQAETCDLFVSLYDGSAGWAAENSAVGICQAEFDAALRLAPSKVQVVRLPSAKMIAENQRDLNFHDALRKAARFEAHIKKDWPELRSTMKDLVRQMVLRAAQEGVRQFKKGGANVGQALDWSRKTFSERSAAMSKVIADALVARDGEALKGGSFRVIVPLEGTETLFCCHGSPRSLSVSAARELVGQPFLNDHTLIRDTPIHAAGPIHLIGCPKGATESQAVSLLGFPDFTVVEGSFGVYAADRTQKIQLCLLADCADPGSTRNSVVRFFEWLERSGEMKLLLGRAAARRRIIEAILAEDENSLSSPVI